MKRFRRVGTFLLSVVLLPAAAFGQYQMASSVVGSGAANGSSTNFKLQGTVGQAAIGTGTSTNFKGSWGFWYTIGGGGTGGFLADLKMLLEGPYTTGGLMAAGIPRDSIPLSQPFNTPPWNYPGTESVAAGFFGTNTDIVDWVLVNIRANSPGPGSPPMDSLTTRVGFVKTDGSVVDTDGTSPLSIPGVAAGTYYVVIDHRNHVRAMSASGVATVNDTLSYDFTDALGKSYTAGPDPVATLGGGYFGLFAGDENGDGQVTANDFNSWLTSTKAAEEGYINPDFNLDGQVVANDFNIWLTNTKAAASSQVPDP